MVVGNLVVEFSVLFLYVVSLCLAYRIKKLDFLIYASVFAAIFENLNVLFFSESVSGYFYSGEFLMYFFSVPLLIILSWGILLLGAHLVSLRLGMSKVSRVFFVALFVALMDFAIEGVFVGLGYWVWTGVVGYGNIFASIAAANFVGWLGVSFGFILCYEYLDKKWLSMGLGYFVFLILGIISKIISVFAGDDGYFSLIVILIVFVGFWVYFYHNNKILKKNKKDFKVNFVYGKYVVFMRAFFYCFALLYFILEKHYFDFVYVVVFASVLMMETYFLLRFTGFVRKKI